jgi:hypothetical protein
MNKKAPNQRLGVTVNAEIYDALAQESDKTGAPISQIVRTAVEKYLVGRGYEVEANVSWGGWKPRKGGEESEPGQLDAVGVR